MNLIFSALTAAAVLGIFAAWPRASLVALTFSLPFIGWSFSVGSWELPLADLTALAALGAFLLRRFSGLFVKQMQPPILWPLLVPFAIFLGIAALSSLLATNPIFALWYFVRWLLFLYFAYVFLPYNLVRTARDLKLAIYALLASLSLVLASGFLSLATQDWQSSFYRLKSVAWFGTYPFGENHNLIAEFLNVGAFMILTLRELLSGERWRRVLDIFFAITALAIILTFSRAGWITLALQFAGYIWFRWWTKRLKLATVVAGSLLSLVIIIPLFWRMAILQADNVSSTENRWLLTEISWQAFTEKPLLGFGSGSYMDIVAANLRFMAKYGAPIDAHGLLQKIVAENGLLGLAAWLFIILVMANLGRQALLAYPKSRDWLMPLFLAASGGLFFQLFNTSYFKGKVWVPLALALAAIRLLEEKRHKTATL